MARNFLIALLSSIISLISVISIFGSASAQDVLPYDNGLATYHTSPRYRESESHPLRVLAYVVHPVGWLAREAIFRPFSYFASATPETRSVMGFREPYDYRQPECFSADDSIPDCRAVFPFNYDSLPKKGDSSTGSLTMSKVYFPDVNFDFDKRTLSPLGQGQVRRLAKMIQESGSGVAIVLQGHTDFMGSDAYNEKLGMDRAEAVRQELVSLGFSADKLSTVTFGESQPIYSEQTDWARAANRRVESHMGTATDAAAKPAAAATGDGEG